MKKINKLTIMLFILLNFGSYSFAEDNLFEKGKNKYDEQNYEESKFLFQRSIVFNPKDKNSYLYLAKIYNFEENKKEEKKNIDTVLLLDPKNEEAKIKYDEKRYEESKFLFQRSIVFNPKDQDAYLYLAKIYKFEDNKKEEQKNINTVLLLDPQNEEANYLLIEIELKKSNYSKVKELVENFTKICKKLCDKKPLILESLKNLEPKNES